MNNKPKFLKRLLATTSIATAIIGASSSAMAGNRTTNALAVDLTAATGLDAAFVNGDNIQIHANNVVIKAGGAARIINKMYTAGFSPVTFNVDQDLTFTEKFYKGTHAPGPAGTADASIDFKFTADNKTLTFADAGGAATYHGTINVNSLAGSKVVFGGSEGHTFKGNLTTGGTAKGIIDAGTKSAIWEGNIGDVKTNDSLATLTIGAIGAAKTFTLKGDANIANINFVHADSVLKLEKAGLTLVAGQTTNAVNGGVIEIAEDATLKGTYGGVNALNKVKIGDAAAKKLTLSGNIKGTQTLEFAHDDSTLIMEGDAEITVGNAYSATTGILQLGAGKHDIDLAFAAANKHLKAVNVTGAGKNTFKQNLHVDGDITFSAAAEIITSKELSLTAGKAIKFTGAAAKDAKITIDTATLGAGVAVDLIKADVTTDTAGSGVLVFKGNVRDTEQNKKIGTAAAPIQEVQINDTKTHTFNDHFHSQKLTFGADGRVEIKGGENSGEVNFADKNATLVFENGSEFKMTVKNTSANKGTFVFKGNAIKGHIGEKGSRIEKLELATVGADPTIDAAVFAKEINVNSGQKFTFSEAITADNTEKLIFSVAGTVQFNKASVVPEIDLGNNNGTVIIADGASLTDTKVHSSKAANIGIIEFTKSGEFSGEIGSKAYKFDLMKAGVDGSVVKIASDTMFLNKIQYQGTGAVQLQSKESNIDVDLNGKNGEFTLVKGSVFKGNITSGAADVGKVVLEGNTTVEQDLGAAGASLESLTLKAAAGENILLKGTHIGAKSLVLDGEGKISIEGVGNVQLVSKGITTKADGKGHLFTRSNLDISGGDIGAANGSLQAIEVEDNRTVSLGADVKNVYTQLTTTKHESAILEITNAGSDVILHSNIGTNDKGSEKHYLLVKAGASKTEFKSAVSTKGFETNGAGELIFNRSVRGNGEFKVQHNNTLTFKSGEVGIKLIDETNGATVRIQENVKTISKAIGVATKYFKVIDFQGKGKSIPVSGDLLADTVNVGENEIVAGANISIGRDGNASNFAKSTINAGKHTVTINGPINEAGTTFKVAMMKDNKSGQIVSTTANPVSFKGQTINLTVGEADAILKPSQEVIVFKGSAKPTVDNGIFTVGNNKILGADAKVDGNNIAFNIKQIAKFETVYKDTESAAANDLYRAFDSRYKDLTGTAAVLATQLATEDPKTVQEMVNRLAPNVTEAISSSARSDNMAALEERGIRLAAAGAEGLASGDAVSQLGGWIKAFGGQATKKKDTGYAGYKSNTVGGMIGLDFAASDQVVVGASIGYVDNKIKHSDFKEGSKSKGQSTIFNVYGLYDFGNNMFSQLSLNFGNTRVSLDDKRMVGADTYQIAQGKYDVMMYGISLLGGYRIKASDSMIIAPVVGIDYAKNMEGGYTETGAGIFNKKVAKREYSEAIAMLGVKLCGSINSADMLVKPELSAAVKYDLIGKEAKHNFTFDGLGGNIAAKVGKPQKASYNVGLGLSAKAGNMEYGVKYDLEIRGKYTSHQGAIKLKTYF